MISPTIDFQRFIRQQNILCKILTNPRLSERHATLLEDDRARADYSNQKAIFGQVICANFYIIAKDFKNIKQIWRDETVSNLQIANVFQTVQLLLFTNLFTTFINSFAINSMPAALGCKPSKVYCEKSFSIPQ